MDASNTVESVPFYQIPNNKTFLLEICEDKILMNFDFAQSVLNIIYLPEFRKNENNIYGYEIDYNLKTDYEFVGYLVDQVGGITLNIDDETLRYTGTQITEMLEFSPITQEIKYEILKNLIYAIGITGFTKENLLYIVENCESELKFNEGILFLDYIADCCKFPRFIN